MKIKNGIYKGANDRESLFDLSIPDNYNGHLIVFIHGFMGFKDWGSWHLVQDFFNKHGFAFCKFNLSHNGGTTNQAEDFPDLEAFGKNTYSHEIKDVECLLKEINPYFKEQVSTHLIGHSRGGGTALLAAEQSKVSSICLWASISSISDRFPDEAALKNWKETGVRFVSNTRTKQKLPQYYSLYEDFYENQDKLNIQNKATSCKIPTAVFHGDADQSVDINEGEALASWLQTNLKVIEGADHVFGAQHPWEHNEIPDLLVELCELSLKFILKMK